MLYRTQIKFLFPLFNYQFHSGMLITFPCHMCMDRSADRAVAVCGGRGSLCHGGVHPHHVGQRSLWC